MLSERSCREYAQSTAELGCRFTREIFHGPTYTRKSVIMRRGATGPSGGVRSALAGQAGQAWRGPRLRHPPRVARLSPRR